MPNLRDLNKTRKKGVILAPISASQGASLVEINATADMSTVVKALEALGFNHTAKDFAHKLDKPAARVLNELTDAALDAFRSKVPIASGELRSHIVATGVERSQGTNGRFKSGSSVTMSREVYVDGKLHDPPYKKFGKKFYKADALALYKDEAEEFRSKTSQAAPGYGPAKSQLSAGWINEGISAFKQQRLKIVKQRLSGVL